jgi:hypothetical protein
MTSALEELSSVADEVANDQRGFREGRSEIDPDVLADR